MSFLYLCGRATKISKYLTEHDKVYISELQLGIKTETKDLEGQIIEEKEVNIANLDEKRIKEVLQKFKGKQKQIPPMHSAIKVKRKETL